MNFTYSTISLLQFLCSYPFYFAWLARLFESIFNSLHNRILRLFFYNDWHIWRAIYIMPRKNSKKADDGQEKTKVEDCPPKNTPGLLIAPCPLYCPHCRKTLKPVSPFRPYCGQNTVKCELTRTRAGKDLCLNRISHLASQRIILTT